MIVFDLQCAAGGHRFEGWFASSDDYAAQQERGLIACPQCGSSEVGKAVMAPSVGRKGNQLAPVRAAKPQAMTSAELPPEAAKLMQALATMQAERLKQSKWVGDSFADQTRAMHYGECEHETIHGQATLGEAKDLLEEGIAVMPLLAPVVPPDEMH